MNETTDDETILARRDTLRRPLVILGALLIPLGILLIFSESVTMPFLASHCTIQAKNTAEMVIATKTAICAELLDSWRQSQTMAIRNVNKLYTESMHIRTTHLEVDSCIYSQTHPQAKKAVGTLYAIANTCMLGSELARAREYA